MPKNTFRQRFLVAIPGLLLSFLAPVAEAGPMIVPPSSPGFRLHTCWAGIACKTPAELFTTMNDRFFQAAGLIALTIFLVGAFMMVISAGQDTLLQNAKRAMKGSLIGLALVTASYGIYRTVVFWLYP